MKRLLMTLFAALLLAAAPMAPQAMAEEDEIYQSLFGSALHGYDPVAYFTKGRPMKGSSDYKFKWKGATWNFASAEHRDMFAADPEKYAPQYGGYCSWAVSQGYTAPTVANAWKIVEGKLYLNYSTSVQKRWEKNMYGLIGKADENWPSVLN